MTNKEQELIEELADIEHQRWADWQQWCHKILREHCPSPELEKVLERWDRQIKTHYSELSEQEKESDRHQVERYYDLFRQSVVEEVKSLYLEHGNNPENFLDKLNNLNKII